MDDPISDLTSDAAPVSAHLAANISTLRRLKTLSQNQLATIAGIPRSTITNMESGSGNPSLSNLCLIATALSVSIEELLSPPRTAIKLTKAESIPVSRRGSDAFIHKLLPDKLRGIAIDAIELKPYATMSGEPHLATTREYLIPVQGEVTVYLQGDAYKVERGDVLAFAGDQAHAYKNARGSTALAISVVLPIPVSLGSSADS